MNLNRNRQNDHVELLPLKSALVNTQCNNNGEQCEVGTTYYSSPSHQTPNSNHPSSSNFFDYTLLSKRTPASKRVLLRPPAQPTAAAPCPLATLSGAPPPSRRREELATMANLRKKVAPQLLLQKRNINRVVTSTPCEEAKSAAGEAPGDKKEQLNSRPKLLQRVLSARPVSMVLQWNEVRTAWQDSDFITDCLCWHNVYRQRHGAPALLMAPELCDYAQTWANHLAHTNKFYYRNDKEVGQNLYQRPVTSLQSDVTGQEASSYWYSAVRQYNYFKEPDVLNANVNAGPFTQMVWVSTRLFGVGKARSRAGKVIVVANYSPPGNSSGHFETSVLPPLPDTAPDPGSASPSSR